MAQVPAQRRRVAIIHPWMPHYRLGFFELLRSELDRRGIDIDLAYGGAPISNLHSGDEHSLPWAVRVPERTLKAGHRSLELRRFWQPAADADLLITEDGLRNADTYRYIASRHRRGLPVAFWGMARVVHKPITETERRAKLALQRKADWYFAYTEGTREWLSGHGFPADRITAIQNSVDTSSIAAARDSITASEAAAERDRLGLTEGHTGLFLGTLASRKRLRFLIEASDRVAAGDPAFRLVVVGTGEDEAMAREMAASRPWLLLQGAVYGEEEKARIAAACDFLAVPGTIGLVAVDSFALGLPIVTTVSEWHSVECEYLEDGRNALFAPNSHEGLAAAISNLIADAALREALTGECVADRARYTVEAMARRFADGVAAALDAGVRAHRPEASGSSRSQIGPITLDALDLDGAAAAVLSGLPNAPRRDVHLVNAYTVALAADEEPMAAVLAGSGLNLVDGKPLTWVSALRREQPRLVQTRGTDVMRAVIDRGRAASARHYLLGSTEPVLEAMKANLEREYPGVEIVGIESPPFRELTAEELAAQDRRIVDSGATVVWVGLGTPKQDFEVARVAESTGIVAMAVGAAFDFLAGSREEAPAWIQRLGLEWLHRLLSEPGRLWRRYLVGNVRFLMAVAGGPKR